MEKITRRAALAGGLLLAAGCQTSRFRTYNGPEVTSIVVFKDSRRMHLYNNNEVLESFWFDLGFAPVGHKQFQGDGRTPEGQYWIDRRNPNSEYHLSIGISYPNEKDVEAARAMGKSPGGDIFIHGTPKRYRSAADWTAGCIAVRNAEIERIYAMVRTGTPIFLYA